MHISLLSCVCSWNCAPLSANKTDPTSSQDTRRSWMWVLSEKESFGVLTALNLSPVKNFNPLFPHLSRGRMLPCTLHERVGGVSFLEPTMVWPVALPTPTNAISLMRCHSAARTGSWGQKIFSSVLPFSGEKLVLGMKSQNRQTDTYNIISLDRNVPTDCQSDKQNYHKAEISVKSGSTCVSWQLDIFLQWSFDVLLWH